MSRPLERASIVDVDAHGFDRSFARRRPAYRDPQGRWVSEGRRQLLAALQKHATTEIASRCGVHHSRISRLSSGARSTDSYALRMALWSHFSIPHESWDLAPVDCANWHGESCYQ